VSHFVRVPYSLLEQFKTGTLSPYDLAVYVLIVEQIHQQSGYSGHRAEISTRQLAIISRLRQQTIGSALNTLETAGVLTVQRKRGCPHVVTLATSEEPAKISTGATLNRAPVPRQTGHPPSYRERSVEKDTTARSAPPASVSDAQIKNRIFGVAAALMKQSPTASVSDLADELKWELARQGIPYDHTGVNDALNTLLTRRAAVERHAARTK
jgi:DNA-binding transcriptional MocR family regulator